MDPTHKRYRRRSDRKLAGVCGGLAQFFSLDPTLIRVLFAVLAVLGGSGILIYLAMWIMVPNEPRARPNHAAADVVSQGLHPTTSDPKTCTCLDSERKAPAHPSEQKQYSTPS
jgi:phage shock protein C